MTPTEQEIKFFTSEEAKRIQELWEPGQGDLAILRGKHVHQRPLLVVQTGYEGGVVYLFGSMQKARNKDTVIWLPRQGQLQAMLEERGYSGELHFGLPTQMGDEAGMYSIEIWRRHIPLERYGQSHIEIETIGPTPSIALGKCLLEVLKDV